jgi:hypothetical protein
MSRTQNFFHQHPPEADVGEEYSPDGIPLAWIHIATAISPAAATSASQGNLPENICPKEIFSRILVVWCSSEGLKPPPFFTSETKKITMFYIWTAGK